MSFSIARGQFSAAAERAKQAMNAEGNERTVLALVALGDLAVGLATLAAALQERDPLERSSS